MNDWLKKHAFQLRVGSFALMMALPIGLYFTARAGAATLTWLLLGLYAAASLLVIRL